MLNRSSWRCCLIAALVLISGACRGTRRLPLDYVAPPADNIGRKAHVFVAPVVDARETRPMQIGELEHGTRIETERDEDSLAKALGSALREELRALGYRCRHDEREVQLAVTIREWSWQEMGIQARFRCALDVAVLDPLASRVRDRALVTHELTATARPQDGAWPALAAANPKAFAEVVQKCLRENEVVLAALAGASR